MMIAMHTADYIAIAGIVAAMATAIAGGSLAMFHTSARRIDARLTALEVTINNGLQTAVEDIRHHLNEVDSERKRIATGGQR